MAEFVCNTSPIQYLHQLGQLDLLRTLATAVFVPPSVVIEVGRGRALGIDLPDLAAAPWIASRAPQTPIHHQWQTNIGLGERDVLRLSLETPGLVAIIDDRIARRVAASLNIPFKGTIGLLIDAKRVGLIRENGQADKRIAAQFFGNMQPIFAQPALARRKSGNKADFHPV